MSDEYTRVSTPSTEDVREYFAFGDFHGWSERVPDRYELFDRWLAEHDRQVAELVHNETVAEMVSTWMSGKPLTIPVNIYAKDGGTP